MTVAMPRAILAAVAPGTMPASASMTIDAWLIWSRNSTERPPPRKTSFTSRAPVWESAMTCFVARHPTRSPRAGRGCAFLLGGKRFPRALALFLHHRLEHFVVVPAVDARAAEEDR